METFIFFPPENESKDLKGRKEDTKRREEMFRLTLMSAARWPAPERHFLAGGLGGSAPTTTTPLLFFRTGVTVTGDWVDDE